jgi:hypothetical protein
MCLGLRPGHWMRYIWPFLEDVVLRCWSGHIFFFNDDRLLESALAPGHCALGLRFHQRPTILFITLTTADMVHSHRPRGGFDGTAHVAVVTITGASRQSECSIWEGALGPANLGHLQQWMLSFRRLQWDRYPVGSTSRYTTIFVAICIDVVYTQAHPPRYWTWVPHCALVSPANSAIKSGVSRAFPACASASPSGG